MNQVVMTYSHISPKASSIHANQFRLSGTSRKVAGFVKRVFPVLLLLVVLVTGCARNYVITLNNGARMTAKGKPKLQNGSYVFKDATGQPARVSAGRVREIAPASMATVEGSQFMK